MGNQHRKNLVECTPENPYETIKVHSKWRMMVDCARSNRKPVHIRGYIPIKL